MIKIKDIKKMLNDKIDNCDKDKLFSMLPDVYRSSVVCEAAQAIFDRKLKFIDLDHFLVELRDDRDGKHLYWHFTLLEKTGQYSINYFKIPYNAKEV